MNDSQREREILARWPRLREEAHYLHKQVRALLLREAELDSRLERAARDHQRERELLNRKIRRLEDRAARLERRIRSIEQSRLWRLLGVYRRLRPGRQRVAPRPGQPEPASTASEVSAAPESPVAPPLDLEAWLERARGAERILVLASDEDDARSADIAGACEEMSCALIWLDGTGSNGIVALPSAGRTSPVPRVLDFRGDAKRIFVSLDAPEASLRWLTVAQQAGWLTVADLATGPEDFRIAYVALHADVLCARGEQVAARLRSHAGRPVATIRRDENPIEAYERAANSAEPPLVRRLLGLSTP